MSKAADLSLFGLSLVYGAAVRARNALYDAQLLPQWESALPVVSVGNISAGGNAKTPLCLHIAEELKKRGLRPAILSRGYKGRQRAPRLVAAEDDPRTVGDEPVLAARRNLVPVVVSRNRAHGARFVEMQNLGDVLILDDGFQHRKLKRQVDIVSVDVSSPEDVDAFVTAALLPFGRMREPRDRALARADMLLFTTRRYCRSVPDLDPRLLRVVPQGLQIYRAQLQPQGIWPLQSSGAEGEAGGPAAMLEPCRIAAFCGIAKPESFFETLRELGFEIAGRAAFGDHYAFREADIEGLRRKFAGLPLVCTEKDAVKIPPQLRENIFMLRIGMRVQPSDAFLVQLTKKVMAHQRPRSTR